MVEKNKVKLNPLGNFLSAVILLAIWSGTGFLVFLGSGSLFCSLPSSGCNNFGGLGAGLIASGIGLVVGLVVALLLIRPINRVLALSSRLGNRSKSSNIILGAIILAIVIPSALWVYKIAGPPSFVPVDYDSEFETTGERVGSNQEFIDYSNILSKMKALGVQEISNKVSGYSVQRISIGDEDKVPFGVGDVVVFSNGGKVSVGGIYQVIGLSGDEMRFNGTASRVVVTRNGQTIWSAGVERVENSAEVAKHIGYADSRSIFAVPLTSYSVDAKGNITVEPYALTRQIADFVREDGSLVGGGIRKSYFDGIVTGVSFGK